MPTYTVVLTHEHADFDALASLLGASLLFPGAIPVLPRQVNRNVKAFLALYKSHFPFIEPQHMPRGHVDLAILVDTRTFNAVKGMDAQTQFLVIDHHSVDEPLPPGWRTWEDALGPHQVGANTTLLVERLMAQDADLTPIQATLLALGIYEDTGGLLYKSTTHRDLRSAAWLLEEGANVEVIHRFTHYPMSEAQQRLSQQLVDNAEHLQIAGQSIVIATAHAPDFEDELSALAHKLRELFDPDGVFVIVDLGDRIQVVARSSTDAVDVGAIAEALGGGGHARAAAALIREGDLQSVRDRIVALARRTVRPPITVSQIMSRGRPQTLTPDVTVGEAARLMRRYGYEGFPVVQPGENGKEEIVGLLSRREADRAMDHGLDRRTVGMLMRTGAVSIREDAPIEELHRLMIESGWGQIPVVNERGELVGIVTRTDLIKLWGKEGAVMGGTQPETTQLLAESLPPVQYRVLRMAGEAASEMGYMVYAVGGFVRDLLLERIDRQTGPLDVDIVVEGDAIRLVDRLRSRCGGRVVAHRRFGTAKWLLHEAEHPITCEALLQEEGSLPPHLDFVTARTEFYTAPTVLPTVEQGSIKLDLHRRDFTINTLAIVLTPDRWGELLDFYGGLADLRRGVIRVLHSLSFVDDPTRILRAVRYEQRFDFHIEPRTLELLVDAVPLLDRVTPARIRHELDRILQEEAPEKALLRLDELGVLARIHPRLRPGPGFSAHCARLRRRLADPADPLAADVDEAIERLYWGLLVYPALPDWLPPQRATRRWASPADAEDEESESVAEEEREDVEEELAERLRLRGETRRLMDRLRHLKAHRDELAQPELPPSRVVEILDPAGATALFLFSILEDAAPIQERLQAYVTRWRDVRTALNGKDLQRMGLRPGPVFGRILGQLRAALLDGRIPPDEAAQRQFVAE
ncbi:MAG: CBS domain-containing protein, partial [Caldilineae bacterium]